jgi:hypothetical protein
MRAAGPDIKPPDEPGPPPGRPGPAPDTGPAALCAGRPTDCPARCEKTPEGVIGASLWNEEPAGPTLIRVSGWQCQAAAAAVLGRSAESARASTSRASSDAPSKGCAAAAAPAPRADRVTVS